MTTGSRFKYSALFAMCLCWITLSNAATIDNTSSSVAGVYKLVGQREMSATLTLFPDQRFEYTAIYGGDNPRAEGTWSSSEGIVELVSNKGFAAFTKIEQGADSLQEVADELGHMPAMAVRVVTPALKMSWRGVDVMFKFANGKTSSGITNSLGAVILGDKKTPDWKGVPVTEIGVAYPNRRVDRTWFKIDGKKTTIVIVHFDPGQMAQAFREGYLEIEPGDPQRLVAGRLLGELRGTYVRKQSTKSEAKH